MLCVGFPCQPFSIAGKALGFDNPRGSIFFKLIEIIATKKPNISFLENVVNLITHDKGRIFAIIISKIAEVGYKVFNVILNSIFWESLKIAIRFIFWIHSVSNYCSGYISQDCIS